MRNVTCDRCGIKESHSSVLKPDILNTTFGHTSIFDTSNVAYSTIEQAPKAVKELRFVRIDKDLCGTCRSAVKAVMIEKIGAALPQLDPQPCACKTYRDGDSPHPSSCRCCACEEFNALEDQE